MKRTAQIDWEEVRRRRWWPGFKRELVIARLLTCYGERTDFDKTAGGRWSNPKFMREFSDFGDLHADELVALVAPHSPGPMFDEAKRLADKWGLSGPQFPSRLVREAAANVVRRRRGHDEWKRYPLYIFPLLPIQVARSADSSPNTMWRERELERNVRWLYERHALKRTPIQIMERYNDRVPEPMWVQQDAVEEGIRLVSRMISLDPTYSR